MIFGEAGGGTAYPNFECNSGTKRYAGARWDSRRARYTDDARVLGQSALVREVIKSWDQLALGQVARGPEDDDGECHVASLEKGEVWSKRRWILVPSPPFCGRDGTGERGERRGPVQAFMHSS